jgi:hypothetical protein
MVKTCVVWVRLPTGWTKHCKNPEALRRRFGSCTPQPFALLSPPGPLYLFCVAMDLDKATGIIESAGGCICCQAAEAVMFDVSRYTPQHSVRTTNRVTPSGEEEFELVFETDETKSRRRWWLFRHLHLQQPVA